MTVAIRLSSVLHFTSNTSGVSDTALDIERHRRGDPLKAEIAKLSELAADPDNTPTAETLKTAKEYLYLISIRAQNLNAWSPPHMTLSENAEIVFEWWRGDRKITFYFGPDTAEYIKVWGTDMVDEMESGELTPDWTLTSILLWLNAA